MPSSAFGTPKAAGQGGAVVFPRFAILYGSTADSFSDTTWTTRTITGKDYDPYTIVVTLAGSVFTLAAGTYLIDATAVGYLSVTGGTNTSIKWQTRIRNTTDSTDVVLGTSNQFIYGTNAQKPSDVSRSIGNVTTTKNTNFTFDHWFASSLGPGYLTGLGGAASGAGIGDRYVKIIITQVS